MTKENVEVGGLRRGITNFLQKIARCLGAEEAPRTSRGYLSAPFAYDNVVSVPFADSTRYNVPKSK